MDFYDGLMGFDDRSMRFIPLGMTNIANWKITMLSMGKSTISTGPFSIAMRNYQRVSLGELIHVDSC